MEPFVTALDATNAEPDPDFVAELRRRVREEATSTTDSPITQTHHLREPVMTKIDARPTEDSDTDGPERGWVSLLNMTRVAAVVILIVGIATFGIIAVQGDEDQLAVGAGQGLSEAGALATAEAFLGAQDAGDLDSVFAMFTNDATYVLNIGPQSAIYSSPATIAASDVGLRGFEPAIAWTMATGKTSASPECAVVDAVPVVSVTISCEYDNHHALAVAAGVVTPLTAEFTVTADGISRLEETIHSPDYRQLGLPFEAWLKKNHPEDAHIAGGLQPTTVEASITRGALRTQYAQEWGAYLQANDCNYLDSCASG